MGLMTYLGLKTIISAKGKQNILRIQIFVELQFQTMPLVGGKMEENWIG